MKKIISILAVITLLCTLVPMSVMAETTVTPLDGDWCEVYRESFNYVDGMTLSSLTHPDNNYIPSEEIKGQQLIYKQSAPGTKGMTYFKFGKEMMADQFVFGFDLEFNNVTEIAENSNQARTIITIAPGTKQYDANDPNRSTCWRFYESSKEKSFIARLLEELDENNNKKIAVGDARFLQGEKYSIWCDVDMINLTYHYYASDEDGNVQNVVSGKVNPYFDDIGQISFTIEGIANHETEVIIDEVFVKYSSAKILNNKEFTDVDNDGKIDISAYIPETINDAKFYINDVFVSDIPKEDGKNGYNIVAQIPNGVTLGDAKLEIRATENGKLCSSIEKTRLIKTTISQMLYESEMSFAEKNFKVEPIYKDGIYKFSFDFKAQDYFRLGIRFRNDSNGKAGSGTLMGVSTSAWTYWHYTDFSNCDIDLGGTNYNHLDFIIDFTGEHGDDIKRPYWIYVNGHFAYNGTHKLPSAFTEDGFNYACFNLHNNSDGDTRNGTVKNVKIERLNPGFAVENIVSTYENGDVSEIQPFNALSLKKIDITTAETIGNVNSENVYFANSTGEKVSGSSVAVNGNTATVSFSGNELLETDNYKLVIGKNATINNVTMGIGDEIEIPVVLKNGILSPENNETLTGDSKLSAFVKDADKVEFYVNNVLVNEFEEQAVDGIYTYDAQFAENGEKTFDVYVYKNGDVSILTRMFNVNKNMKYNVLTTPYSTPNEDGALVLADNAYVLKETLVLHTGRVCFEATVTLPSTNSHLWLEIGGQSSDITATDSGFETLSDGVGYMTQDGNYNLFNANGTIYRNGRKYEANTPYRIKYVIDFDKQQTEFYVNGIHEGTKAFGTVSKKCKYVYYKIRHKGNKDSSTLAPGITYDNTTKYIKYEDFVLYSECESPAISDIKSGDVSLKTEYGYIATEGITSADVYLTKAYDAIDESLVEVKVNETTVSPKVTYDKATAKISLSGLSMKKGDILSVKISSDATLPLKKYYKSDEEVEYTAGDNVKKAKKIKVDDANTEKTGIGLSDLIYTKDSAGLVVLPLKYSKNENAVTAFAKYINGGETKEGNMLLGTWASANRYSSVDYKGVTFDAATTGLVSISGTVGAKWNANLWDANYQALTESIGE